jgi:hypothetical protein
MKPGRSNGLDRLDVPNEYAVRREGSCASVSLVTREMEDLLPHTEKRFRHQRLPWLAKRRSGWTALKRNLARILPDLWPQFADH